jgi:hypothetical protein
MGDCTAWNRSTREGKKNGKLLMGIDRNDSGVPEIKIKPDPYTVIWEIKPQPFSPDVVATSLRWRRA